MLKVAVVACLLLVSTAYAQRSPVNTRKIRTVMQGSLIAPGSSPFHLTATVTQGRESARYADIELWWFAPDKYRRVIHATDFDETLVADGANVYDRSAQGYFPVGLHTLVTAMLDPKPIVNAVQEGDRVETVSNGAFDENGTRCFKSPRGLMCAQSGDGVHEVVAASGHSVEFSHYETFEGKKVARVLTNAPRLGEELMTLVVTSLKPINSSSTEELQPPTSTAGTDRLTVEDVSESDLRAHTVGSPDIVWPQPLDGATKGPASFYVSVDRQGKVREVQQLYTVNERTNDSAMSQIRKWQFTPFLQDGKPVQAEGILHFELDTRKFGPTDVLTDAQARQLATNAVGCKVDSAALPAGTKQTEWTSVDSEGHVIEILIGDDGVHGPNGTGIACMQAVQQWQFKLLMQDGKPVPFRAGIVFNLTPPAATQTTPALP